MKPSSMEEPMPPYPGPHTLIVLAGVRGAFTLFTASLVFADMTW
jgi:hypothetical protein